MLNQSSRSVVSPGESLLKKVSSTYASMYQGYIVEHGIQVVLFQVNSESEAIQCCKEFVCTHNKQIYVNAITTILHIKKFVL